MAGECRLHWMYSVCGAASRPPAGSSALALRSCAARSAGSHPLHLPSPISLIFFCSCEKQANVLCRQGRRAYLKYRADMIFCQALIRGFLARRWCASLSVSLSTFVSNRFRITFLLLLILHFISSHSPFNFVSS
jgi:hypothetical protein